MLDMSDDDVLLPRMSLLMSPKPLDYEDDQITAMKKSVSFKLWPINIQYRKLVKKP